MKILTTKMLIAAKACPDQVRLFRKLFPSGATLTATNIQRAFAAKLDVLWLPNLLDRKTSIHLAADFAEHVLPIFEKQYPEDDRPRLAIQAARDCADGKTTAAAAAAAAAAADNAAYAAANAATDAAYAYAAAAAANAATNAAYAAAYAAYAAAYAAYAAANAAAYAYAARYAAYAAAADARYAAYADAADARYAAYAARNAAYAERKWQFRKLLIALRKVKS